jgi:hypothetical protein
MTTKGKSGSCSFMVIDQGSIAAITARCRQEAGASNIKIINPLLVLPPEQNTARGEWLRLVTSNALEHLTKRGRRR